MKKIEVLVDASKVDAIQERLALIGILRLTTFEVNVLPVTGASPPPTLFYRGVGVVQPVRRMQVQVLVDDVLADAVVTALGLVNRGDKRGSDSILTYPVAPTISGEVPVLGRESEASPATA